MKVAITPSLTLMGVSANGPNPPILYCLVLKYESTTSTILAPAVPTRLILIIIIS